jgi:formate C-acetyltransferase
MNQRTEQLKNIVVNNPPEICPDRGLAITKSFKETEGKPIVLRRSLALEKILEEMSIYILPGELIVGNQASKPRAAPLFPEFGVKWLSKEIDGLPKRKLDSFQVSEETKRIVAEVIKYWDGKTHQDLVLSKIGYTIPEEWKPAFNFETCSLNQVVCNASHTSTGDGHIIVNYEKVLQKGLNGIIQEASEELSKLDLKTPDQINKKLFLEAIIVVCRALIKFAHRFSRKASELAERESVERKGELLNIAEICQNVPANPARTFWEALQSYWFIHLALQIESNGHSISFGRFDQILYPFYERDIHKKRVTREKALELIECFFIKSCELSKVREWVYTEYMSGYPMFQTLTLGGQTRTGEDATNEISLLALEATRNLKMDQPTTIVRIHDGTPDEFLLEATKTLVEHRGGLPGFFGDESAIPLFLNLKQNITLEEARDWAVVGCCEPVIPGKYTTITGGVCHVNLLKILEISLNDGLNPQTEVRLCPGRGKISELHSFEEILKAFRDQIAYYLAFIPFSDAITCSTYEELTPTPFLSSVIDGRIQYGKDVSAGWGSHNYNVGMIHVHGSANVGNCLAALKQLVFEEKKINPKELEEALAANFDGYERMRQRLLNQAPKYGNDDSTVDFLVRDILNFVIKEMEKHPYPRGGVYAISTQTLTTNVPDGRVVGATPDGRKAGEPIADNNSPTAGTDRNGPTAAMKSVGRLEHSLIAMGTIFNMKFHPTTFYGEDKKKKFASLLRTYFDMKGFEVQFNVISPEILIDAQKHPEEYRDLIVKVAGYSARFSTLDKELQDQIILRTMHQLS